jgi:hypothetical protein
MAMVLIQPLTETSTKNLPGGGREGNAWLMSKADNLTAICEQIV